MHWPFVSRKKYATLQEASSKLYRQVMDAHRAMDRIDGNQHRTEMSLAHRIRLHSDEERFQQRADASGKTYTWVCTGDDLTSLFAAASSPRDGIPAAPTFHQHSVTPKESE